MKPALERDSITEQETNARLTGDVVLGTNAMTRAYAYRYFVDFCSNFEITETGALEADKKTLARVKEWFNRSYVLISLITGIPLSPIDFVSISGRGRIQTRAADDRTMLHVYAVSYTMLLKMASLLSVSVPEQFRPRVSNVEMKDEDYGNRLRGCFDLPLLPRTAP